MNKVILVGNLTRDPEIKYAQTNNMAIARFTIAVSRRFKREGEPDSDFFNCTAFGKTAEFVQKYFTKGKRMMLIGRIQNDNYTNKNGEKVYSVQILAEEVEFGEKKGAGETAENNDDDFMPVPEADDDTIPFFNA